MQFTNKSVRSVRSWNVFPICHVDVIRLYFNNTAPEIRTTCLCYRVSHWFVRKTK